MSAKKRKKRKKTRPPATGGGAEPELPPGVKLLRTLEGHEGAVRSVAFDPQGGTLASGSNDYTVKLWDARSGKLLRTLKGHEGTVYSVAFDAQDGTLASGSADETVKLWDARSGKLLRTLEGHENHVGTVAFDPQGGTLASPSADTRVKLWEAPSGKLLHTLVGHESAVPSAAFDPQGVALASGSFDHTVKLWDAQTGELLRTLDGHKDQVWSVAFDPSGVALASGSADATVKLWEWRSGKLLRTLEGHTGDVDVVAFSPDGRLLASESRDETIRLWSCETWETVAVIPEPTAEYWTPALAFHPTEPVLAAAGSEPCRLIHLWELDYDVLVGKRVAVTPVAVTATVPEVTVTLTAPAVHHRTAKVILVGDTGVGKSGLAHRLVRGKFVDTRSSHARQALVLDRSTVKTAGGVDEHRETVLWDLAGQPAYRLVHQLAMDDAAVACVLVDARSETNPLEGAAYWSQALDQARTNAAVAKLLVPARIDVGGLPASGERLRAFAREHGFAGVFPTSAFTGEGCEALLEAIREHVHWDDMPAVSSTKTLAALRDFVGRLKGEDAAVSETP